MNDLTKALLGGVAVCALAALPAAAENASPILPFHITALHAGRVVNKTKMPNHGATHVTYTFGIYGYVSESTAFQKKLRLAGFRVCPPVKIKVAPRKTPYAKIGTYRETYSTGCNGGPSALVGATYKLTNPDSEGATDTFVLSVTTKFEQNGTKYKGTINLDYSISIE